MPNQPGQGGQKDRTSKRQAPRREPDQGRDQERERREPEETDEE